MENATEALKLAAWVLLFVVALSICINSFTEARQTMDTILEYNDREYDYTYVEEAETTQRTVGYESIIPTIYRAYKENYKIIFPDSYVLYTRTVNGEKQEIHSIDLENENLGRGQEEEFIKRILFIRTNDTTDTTFPNIQFEGKSLYERIKGNKYIEKLGEYYQTEVGETEESSTPDANKTKKRVITYEEI